MAVKELSVLLDKIIKEKKNPNQEEKNKYYNELISLLNTQNIDKVTVHYIINGFKFNAPKAYVVWSRQYNIQQQYDLFYNIITSKEMESMDNDKKLRVYFNFLVWLLQEEERNNLVIGQILIGLPELSRKKDGTIKGTVKDAFRTSFFYNVNPQTRIPLLSSFNFQLDQLKELLEIFGVAIKDLDGKNERERNIAYSLKSWYAESKKRIDEKEKIVLKQTEDNDNESEKNGSDIESTKESGKEKAEQKEEPVIKGKIAKQLMKYVYAINDFEEKQNSLSSDLKNKENEITRLKLQIDHLQTENEKMLKKSMEMEENLKVITREKNELVNANKELSDRVTRQVEVIDVYDEDKANQKTELVNQIASALKKIYEDYQDAEDMEMTVDLGENMRDHVEDIFRKLKKFGIDVEGR